MVKEDEEQFCELMQSFLNTYKANSNFFLTIDLETDGLDYINGNILLFSISWNGKHAMVFSPYFMFGENPTRETNRCYDLLLKVLEVVPISNQNIKFDAKWWYYQYGILVNIFFDTMVASQLCYAGCWPAMTFALDNIVKYILYPMEISKGQQTSFIGQPVTQEPTWDQVHYAANDSLVSHRLVEPLISRLHNNNLYNVWKEIELPLITSLIISEVTGVAVDIPAVKEAYSSAKINQKKVYDDIQSVYSSMPPAIKPVTKDNLFNPNSSQQVISILSAMGYMITSSSKDALSNVLLKYPDADIAKLILEYRKIHNGSIKYFKAWLEEHINPSTGCIHPNFKSCHADTGRMASSDPNMQNIPPGLRHLIIAKPGRKIITADYSQFEFRAAGAYTGEQVLIDLYCERADLLPIIKNIASKYGEADPDHFVKSVKKGKITVTPGELEMVDKFAFTDVHRRNSALVLGTDVSQVTDKDRGLGKTLGYALLYGAGPGRMLEQLYGEGFFNITIKDCSYYRDVFMKQLPKVAQFIKETHERVKNPGFIETFCGRKRFFTLPPAYQTRYYEQKLADAQRQAVNAVFQASNADATKMSLVEATASFNTRFETDIPVVLLNVHDEIVSEAWESNVDEAADLLVKIMIECGEKSLDKRIPVEVSMSIGNSWTK